MRPLKSGPGVFSAAQAAGSFDLASLGHNSPAYLHLYLEAAKLAFADRERYYGDPAFVDVPLADLLSEPYTQRSDGA